MAPKDDEAKLAELRKSWNKKFRSYRDGTYNKPDRTSIGIPLQDAPFRGLPSRFLDKVKKRARGDLWFRRHPVLTYNERIRQGGEEKPEVKGLLKKNAASFFLAGLKYVKTLGAGGQGLAALFRARNSNGKEAHLVAKIVLSQNRREPATLLEKKLGRMYARATHIVQGFDLPGFFPPLRADSLPGVQRHPDDPPEAPFKWFIDRVQTDPNVLLLEYGKFGDLHRLLNTAGYLGVLFPDKALWKIFRCLVKGLIALEYPPCHQPTPGSHNAKGPPLDEKVCPPPNGTNADIAHFDTLKTIAHSKVLVLVFDFDQNKHNSMPTFKISDLGMASSLENREELSLRDTWGYRWRGKTGWLTPEQFTSDWERFTDPLREAKTWEDRVAGHFRGAPMNIWQTAMIIWCCITLSHPEMPPVPEEVEISMPIPAPPTETPVPAEAQSLKLLTYGAFILDPEFDWYSQKLRHTVLWCLAHHPENRPDLQTLLHVIDLNDVDDRANGPEGPAVADEDLRTWVELLLTGPLASTGAPVQAAAAAAAAAADPGGLPINAGGGAPL